MCFVLFCVITGNWCECCFSFLCSCMRWAWGLCSLRLVFYFVGDIIEQSTDSYRIISGSCSGLKQFRSEQIRISKLPKDSCLSHSFSVFTELRFDRCYGLCYKLASWKHWLRETCSVWIIIELRSLVRKIVVFVPLKEFANHFAFTGHLRGARAFVVMTEKSWLETVFHWWW